ncbi:flagellar export chaperone FlgN [Thermoanaerobacterium sp. R66]|uniref:flagellar export chaperone FlgN n=1 Tax=Thermoanaerobacterium sp. R66 TaxID=2742479 RepID=UPI002380B0F4|nr:flagellar export chaperone FlgN [Thermoanaerobacterium sp. R66]MDE4542526.1 flagellar export chaperone FlgN [Thermoanaerobacterium sp. R66]
MVSDIKKLIELAEKKLNYLNEMLQLNNQLNIAINSQKLDDIKNILEKKQDIIASIDEIDSEFLPMYNLYKKVNRIDSIFNTPNNSADKSVLKGILIDIKGTLEKIKEVEDKNLEDINCAFKNLEEKINDVAKGKKGYIEYLKYYTPGSYFVDKKR